MGLPFILITNIAVTSSKNVYATLIYEANPFNHSLLYKKDLQTCRKSQQKIIVIV